MVEEQLVDWLVNLSLVGLDKVIEDRVDVGGDGRVWASHDSAIRLEAVEAIGDVSSFLWLQRLARPRVFVFVYN